MRLPDSDNSDWTCTPVFETAAPPSLDSSWTTCESFGRLVLALDDRAIRDFLDIGLAIIGKGMDLQVTSWTVKSSVHEFQDGIRRLALNKYSRSNKEELPNIQIDIVLESRHPIQGQSTFLHPFLISSTAWCHSFTVKLKYRLDLSARGFVHTIETTIHVQTDPTTPYARGDPPCPNLEDYETWVTALGQTIDQEYDSALSERSVFSATLSRIRPRMDYVDVSGMRYLTELCVQRE